MGFSRQEYCSGLPCPPPGDLPNPGIQSAYLYLLCFLHWPKVKSLSCLRLLPPHGLYSPPGSSVHGILQARILMWVAIPFSRESSQPGIEPALQADSLPSGPPGNPRAKHLRIVFGCCSAAPPGEEGGGHQVEGDLTTSAPRAGNSSQSKSVMEKHQVTRHQ